MKYFFILILSFFHSFFVSGQQIFSKQINPYNSQSFSNSLAFVDSAYFIYGGTTKGGIKGVYLINSDILGNINTKNFYSLDSVSTYSGLATSLYSLDKNDGYISAGTLKQSNGNRLILFRFSLLGDTLWTRTYPVDSIYYPYLGSAEKHIKTYISEIYTYLLVYKCKVFKGI